VISSAVMRPRPPLTAAVLALALAMALTPVRPACLWAQEPAVTYHGQVLWIAGHQLMFRDDDGWTFPLDLRRLDQAAYRGLRTGDWITVVGVIARSRSHVIVLSMRADY
jgi:hypothetical protein